METAGLPPWSAAPPRGDPGVVQPGPESARQAPVGLLDLPFPSDPPPQSRSQRFQAGRPGFNPTSSTYKLFDFGKVAYRPHLLHFKVRRRVINICKARAQRAHNPRPSLAGEPTKSVKGSSGGSPRLPSLASQVVPCTALEVTSALESSEQPLQTSGATLDPSLPSSVSVCFQSNSGAMAAERV